MPCGYGSPALIHHGSVAFVHHEAQAGQSITADRPDEGSSKPLAESGRQSSVNSRLDPSAWRHARTPWAALTVRDGHRRSARTSPAVRRAPQGRAEGIQSACVQIRTSSTRPVQLLAPFASTTTPRVIGGGRRRPPSAPIPRSRKRSLPRPTRVEPEAGWRFKEEAVARRDFSKFEQDSPARLSLSSCRRTWIHPFRMCRTDQLPPAEGGIRPPGHAVKQLQKRRKRDRNASPSLSRRAGVRPELGGPHRQRQPDSRFHVRSASLSIFHTGP